MSNSLNSDGLSPLDMAVLSNNRSMTKMLLQNGATEGNTCEYKYDTWLSMQSVFIKCPCNCISVETSDSLGSHLNNLLREAENRIHELSGLEDIPQAPFSTRASFSSIIGEFPLCQWYISKVFFCRIYKYFIHHKRCHFSCWIKPMDV